MIFKEEEDKTDTQRNSYVKVGFSGSIYHLVPRQKMYCNTISEAPVDAANLGDVQQ